MTATISSVDRLRRTRPKFSSAPVQANRVFPTPPTPLQAGMASISQQRVLDQVADLSPTLASILRPQAAYRWLLPYLAAITPQYIESVLRGALAGNHVQAWELFDLMIDSDPEIASCVQEYNEGVLKKKFVFDAYHDEDAEPSDTALEKCKVVSAALRNMRPDLTYDENDLRATCRDLLASIFHGQSVVEIEWHDRPDGEQLNLRDIPDLGQVLCPRATFWVHPVCYGWDMSGRLGLRTALTDTLGATRRANLRKPGSRADSMAEPPAWNWITSQPNPSNLSPFPANKFLISIHKAKTGTALGSSKLRSLAWWWCASNFCGDWLLNYAQLFGIPFRKATYDPSCTPAQQSEIKQMLQAMGSAGYCLLPDTAELEFEKTAGATGESPQAFLFHFANEMKRKVILHQTMSGGTASGGSKGVGKSFGEVEGDVKQDCIDEGARYVESVLNLQLVPMILNLNYGEGGDMEAPTVRLVDDDEGSYTDAQRDQILTQLMDVDEDYLHKKYRIPKAAKGAKIAGIDVGTMAQQAADAKSQAAASTAASITVAKHNAAAAQASAKQATPGVEEGATEAARALLASAAGKALAETVAPLIERLKAILKISDRDTRIAALKKFLKDEPDITKALKLDPMFVTQVSADALKDLDYKKEVE